MVVLLRDGRKFFGILRSYDQFGTFSIIDKIANLVLQDTIERIILPDAYSENHYGLFVIRGENVVLLGEVVNCYYLPVQKKLASLRTCPYYKRLPIQQKIFQVGSSLV